MATPKITLAFDPEAEGAIFLFTHACIKLYPAGDSALESYLTSRGVTKLPEAEARQYTRTNQSRAFSVSSVKKYILALEDDNLCTVFADAVNRENLYSTWEMIRKRLASKTVSEKTEATMTGALESKHYSYYINSNQFILTITITAKSSTAEKTDFIISAVSAMRAKQIKR